MASLGQEKTTRKVSIFDESSREGSENSQDDEQFRARREFLKSGLPESFRKQMAKTAATKEAYSLSCSSFQPVIHMKQPPTGRLVLYRNMHVYAPFDIFFYYYYETPCVLISQAFLLFFDRLLFLESTLA